MSKQLKFEEVYVGGNVNFSHISELLQKSLLLGEDN